MRGSRVGVIDGSQETPTHPSPFQGRGSARREWRLTCPALSSLGGNVGDARDTIARAIAAFCDGTDVTLLARSSDYRTPPWGVTDQAPFVNACIAVETRLSPRGLLDRAHEVERTFGRDRHHETRWGPRTLDIDILAYDDVALDEPN